MKQFNFSGGSDDLFEIDGAIREELCDVDGPFVLELRRPDGAGIRIVGIYDIRPYNNTGCWLIGASLLDEDKPVDWPIRMDVANRYCNEMVVDADDDAELYCILPKSEARKIVGIGNAD